MSDSILVVGDATPSISEDFLRRLKACDPDLFVSWSPTRRRFVIEQCVEHQSPTAEHNHLCRKIYVWMVQDPDKCMLPLGDCVFNKLNEMRTVTESFGGPTERGLRNFRQYTDSVDNERREKEASAMREIARLNSLDHRIQLNKAHMLLTRHDMRVNH